MSRRKRLVICCCTVALAVGATFGQSLLLVTPGSVSYLTEAGLTQTSSTLVAVSSNGVPLAFDVATNTSSGGAWLSADATSGTTPRDLKVTINPKGLGPGTYNGTVTLAAAGAANSPQTITAQLLIAATNTMILASPTSLQFSATAGGVSPTRQTVSLSLSDGALPFSNSVQTTSGGNWLSIDTSSGVAPSNVTVTANPTGLPVGTYKGTILVTVIQAKNTPLLLPVELTITSGPGPQSGTLHVNPTSLEFQATDGVAGTIEQPVQFSSSGQEVPFSMGPITDSWLAVTPTGGTTPALLHVLVTPKGLVAGDYNSKIVLQSPGSTNVEIPVHLHIAPLGLNAFTVDAPALQFSVNKSVGTSGPAPMQVMLVTSHFTVDLGVRLAAKQASSWLAVSPSQATVSPGQSVQVQIQINPALLPGGLSQADTIVVSAGSQVQEIPVVVTIGDGTTPQPLISAPAVTLQTVHGEYDPDEKQFLLYNAGSGAFNWTVTHTENTIDVNPVTNASLNPKESQLLKTALTALVSTLEVGEYPAKLIFNFSNTQQPIELDVHVDVLAQGPLPPRPNTAGLFLGLPGQPSQTVTLRSFVPTPVNFKITTDASWISVTPLSSQIPRNGSIDLAVMEIGRAHV